ncbi:hypothetical protein KQI76_08010 [Amphibacillus sp. MSJ-3]|uniref:hypothetical protein n=1 Tax=Amphibacillus sp. MSJ-3 TaxID=2841505 RepID=UPI001C0EE288|nr:hypothetical protein [Amphibacillus sp. MSJ-3]MBU5595109.1 hypothetical protein [Amphibacillus sp. MSJ-3]
MFSLGRVTANIPSGMDPPSVEKVIWKERSLFIIDDIVRDYDFGFVIQSFHLIPQLVIE